MAKIYSTLKSTTDKAPALQPTERFYTVGYTPNGGLTTLRPPTHH